MYLNIIRSYAITYINTPTDLPPLAKLTGIPDRYHHYVI